MSVYRRENYLQSIRGFYHDTDLIKVITGVRRCGKSCLMESIAEELRDSGIDDAHIVYLDLDLRKYRGIKTADRLEKLIDERTPESGKTYLFIDEIQNVREFEEVVNAFRGEGRHSIFITGSNSYLLSGELVTKLTGRYVEFEMFPLTFDEYLGMKDFLGKTVSQDLVSEFDAFLRQGGFPKALQYDSPDDRKTYIRSVISEIFQKDIKKRIKIRNVAAFQSIQDYLINNFGATTSLTNLLEDLERIGIHIKRETLNRYITILKDAKILCECNRFDLKSRRSIGGEQKFYLSDLGFYFATNTDNRINFGPALENIVYVYARTHGYSVSIGRIGALECDFIFRHGDADYAYAQIAMTIMADKATEDREYAPLEMIRDNYPKFVLTRNDLIQKRGGIIHANLPDFMGRSRSFLRKTLAVLCVALASATGFCGCDKAEAVPESWKPVSIAGRPLRWHCSLGSTPWVCAPEKGLPDRPMFRSLIGEVGWGARLRLDDPCWFNLKLPKDQLFHDYPLTVDKLLGPKTTWLCVTTNHWNRNAELLGWYQKNRPETVLGITVPDAYFPWFGREDYDCDREDFVKWRAAHPSFRFFNVLNESDGSFLGAGYSAETNPVVRARMEKAFPPGGYAVRSDVWLKQAMKQFKAMHFGCDDFFSLFSVNCKWGHALARAGVKTLGYECELYKTSAPWRFGMCHIRGAARQWGLPFEWYSAHLIDGYRRDGKREEGEWWVPTKRWPKATPDLGASLSLLERNWMYGYFAGASALGVEQPEHWLADDLTEKDRLLPTKYAKAYDAVFEYAESHPDRGAVYTPVAVLTSCFEGFNRIGFNVGEAKSGLAVNAFFWTLVPTLRDIPGTLSNRGKGDQGCLWNSEFGEICDVLAPDAGQKPGIFAKVLAPYKWAFMMSGYRKETLETEAIRDWVLKGGTLVVSEDMIADGVVTDEMTGVAFTTNAVVAGKTLTGADGCEIAPLADPYDLFLGKATTAKPLFTDGKGAVVAYDNRFGKGRVITVAAYQSLPRECVREGAPGRHWFWHIQKDIGAGKIVFPIQRELLRMAQRETMPVAVEGDVQWGVNRIESKSRVEVEERNGSVHSSTSTSNFDSSHWLVWLINNKGVTKFQREEQVIDRTFYAKVKVTNKATGATREVTVPAGGWKTVEL